MKNLAKKTSLIAARTVNLLHNHPRESIFYLHIPKCGGTSVNKALQECYFRWSFSDTSNIINLDSPASWKAVEDSTGTMLSPDTVNDHIVMQFREKLLMYYMSQMHLQFISGHFPFSTKAYQAFADKYAFITLLRNPVDRWISSYFYNLNRQRYQYRKIQMSVEDYIKSEYGRSQGYEYAKFLSGIDENGKFISESAVYRAQENLHKFKVVGLLEDMKSFIDCFEVEFGRRPNIKVLNKQPSQEDPVAWAAIEKAKEQIQEICQPDLKVYEYALKHIV